MFPAYQLQAIAIATSSLCERNVCCAKNKFPHKIPYVLEVPTLAHLTYIGLQFLSRHPVHKKCTLPVHTVTALCNPHVTTAVGLLLLRFGLVPVGFFTLCRSQVPPPSPQDTSRTTSPFCRTHRQMPRPRPGSVYRGSHVET